VLMHVGQDEPPRFDRMFHDRESPSSVSSESLKTTPIPPSQTERPSSGFTTIVDMPTLHLSGHGQRQRAAGTTRGVVMGSRTRGFEAVIQLSAAVRGLTRTRRAAAPNPCDT
jgi:hypothetical protein